MSYILSKGAGTRDHGFAEDLDRWTPDHDAPAVVDASKMVGIHPLLAVRLQFAINELRDRGKAVDLKKPLDPPTRSAFTAFRIGEAESSPPDAIVRHPSEVVLRLARLSELNEVDRLAEALFSPLVEQFDDVAVVRDAVVMAIGELCQNAVEHGASTAGTLVAASNVKRRDSRQVLLAVGDLGIGIPDHIRGQPSAKEPLSALDEHAIGQALAEGVTGTQRADRGFGFSWVLKETLASASTAAEMFIRAGRGAYRRRIVDGRHDDHGWPVAPTRGTWVAHSWTTVGTSVRRRA